MIVYHNNWCGSMYTEHFLWQQTTDQGWARLSVQNCQHCWQMLWTDWWLVRVGGCFRIPRRAVCRNASWRGDCSCVRGETSSVIPRGVTVQRQGGGMPYMLISTQIRLVCILSVNDACHGLKRKRRRARVGDSGIYLFGCATLRILQIIKRVAWRLQLCSFL